MDKHSVISLENNTDISTKVKPQSALLIKKEFILFTYFLQVRKSYYITVTITQRLKFMHWLIYDGPLFQSNIINASEGKENTVKLSSFRCLLQILLKERSSSFLFNYSSIRIQVHSKVTLDGDDHISVSLPNTECSINKNLCALNIFAKYGRQVNVSVIKMTYKGTESKTCKYAGLVATQHLGADDYKETVALCESYDGNVSQRNVFSYNSSIVLVLYWYGSQDIIKTTAFLSVTKCKPVEICPCTYYLLCVVKKNNQTLCSDYLRKQMEFSNVNLEIGVFKISYFTELQFLFYVNENECFVMQILRNTSEQMFLRREIHCTIYIVPKPISSPNDELKYSMVGSLKGQPTLESKCFLRSCIWFRGTADMFCFRKIGEGKKLNCIESNQFYTDKFYSMCSERLTQLGKDLDFVVSAKSRTPTYLNVFNILLHSHLHANGWIDITIFRNSQNLKENRFGTKYISQTIRMKLRSPFLMEATKSSGLRTQVIMLKFDPKKALQLRRLRYPIGAYIKSMFPRHTVLKWDSTGMQSKSSGIYFIALPGKTIEVSIFKGRVQTIKSMIQEFQIKMILNNMNISIVYTHDNYKNYSYLTSHNISKCDNILTATLHGFKCFTILTSQQSNIHYMLLEKNLNYDYPSSQNQHQYPSDRYLSSWKQASELCRNADAYLPYFTNKEDLEELLALLKLSEDKPPIEALFIGLKFVGSGKVRYWFRERERQRETERETDRQTDRQRDRQTERHRDIETE